MEASVEAFVEASMEGYSTDLSIKASVNDSVEVAKKQPSRKLAWTYNVFREASTVAFTEAVPQVICFHGSFHVSFHGCFAEASVEEKIPPWKLLKVTSM